ncbi:F0F1 ATP synthase subunit B [Rhodovulum sp. BSW8]|uniref:ATP synthase subunit b n=1 Tax=Rhodovulum visakhapatnamense TaxID=364297 RepID=A0A4R8G0Z8_9RHOB|nr:MULTISPECIES: F0F1 ATP synthase subunit B [Rhodovulum]RBO52460.1 F0F1 ATP synthase subunit B [Rhodovulum sp. BSW8]TDX33185.1 F-type H+-transporting ATPase subunit b [Rhodovulum visakhapatnamense]
MKKLAVALMLSASPALAAEGPFFSLNNAEFVVTISFVAFLALLVYLRVPGKLMAMLDKRAAEIKSDLDEARALREEAQTVLASYERKQKEVQAQAERIVETARTEAEAAAAKAKDDLKVAIARRLAAADEQIESAKSGAVKEVRDRAIAVAVAAAREVIVRQMTDQTNDKLVQDAIGEVRGKLHLH